MKKVEQRMSINKNINIILGILFLSIPSIAFSVTAPQHKNKKNNQQSHAFKNNNDLQESSIHPVWYTLNSGVTVQRKGMTDKYRAIANQMGAIENPKIPKKMPNICRVATYNVHFWRNPYGVWGKKDTNDFHRMMHVIRRISPDILILQEVGGLAQDMSSEFDRIMKEMGYAHMVCCSTSPDGVDAPGMLYNCIISKYPFAKPPVKKQYATNPDVTVKWQHPEQRCFVNTLIQLPNNKKISVYGTHLEVRPILLNNKNARSPETVRKMQLQELLQFIKDNDTNDNIIIGADFNGFRKQDLEKYEISNRSLWNILQTQWSAILKQMDAPRNLRSFLDQQPSSLALDYLADQNYSDSFAKSGFTPPQFTTWTGTRVDFLFLNPIWNLPVKGSYVFYDWSSDHIPVIMDVSI